MKPLNSFYLFASLARKACLQIFVNMRWFGRPANQKLFYYINKPNFFKGFNLLITLT